MRLPELQRAFQARILSFEGGIEAELSTASATDLEARLGAYVNGYRARLVEALGTTYPALKATLGDEEFDRQMRLYVDSTPSRHFSVRHYGEHISSRLKDCTAGGAGTALAELAHWEWILADVFDAPDDEAVGLAAVSAVAPEAWPNLCFALRACVRRVQTRSNAVDWWRAATGASEKPRALEEAPPVQWLLWRRGVKTMFRSLDSVEAQALDAVGDGVAFGAICERLAQQVGEAEAALRAASLLRGWIAEELIAGFSEQSAAG
jgi:hypothetical protein